MLSKSITVLDTFRLCSKKNFLIPFHIQRTFETLQFLKIPTDLTKIQKIYASITDQATTTDRKCRIEFNPQDIDHPQIDILEIESIEAVPKIILAKNHDQLSGLGLQNYKTNQRQYWQNQKMSFFNEVLGVNTLGQVTETARFNVFIKQNNVFYTPALNSGCINGCLRRFFIAQKYIQIQNERYELIEKNFLFHEISSAEIYLGNSLRGLLKAQLISN